MINKVVKIDKVDAEVDEIAQGFCQRLKKQVSRIWQTLVMQEGYCV